MVNVRVCQAVGGIKRNYEEDAFMAAAYERHPYPSDYPHSAQSAVSLYMLRHLILLMIMFEYCMFCFILPLLTRC